MHRNFETLITYANESQPVQQIALSHARLTQRNLSLSSPKGTRLYIPDPLEIEAMEKAGGVCAYVSCAVAPGLPFIHFHTCAARTHDFSVDQRLTFREVHEVHNAMSLMRNNSEISTRVQLTTEMSLLCCQKTNFIS